MSGMGDACDFCCVFKHTEEEDEKLLANRETPIKKSNDIPLRFQQR